LIAAFAEHHDAPVERANQEIRRRAPVDFGGQFAPGDGPVDKRLYLLLPRHLPRTLTGRSPTTFQAFAEADADVWKRAPDAL
jgi:hypothetical protein